MYIIFGLLFLVLTFSLNALILKFIAKKLKVKNNTYKNAFLISVLELLFNGIIGVIIGLFLSSSMDDIISTAIGFILFNILCKKYYNTNSKKNFFIYLLLNLIFIACVVITVLPFKSFVAEPFYVSGNAMSPTLPDKTYLIINKFDNNFQRGDVITFKDPQETNQYFIKRIIGLPGEKIEIKNGSVYIYNNENLAGIELGEPYILDGVKILSSGDLITTLSQDEYYVLGDNAGVSKDSRYFGPVNKKLINGKYWFTPKLY